MAKESTFSKVFGIFNPLNFRAFSGRVKENFGAKFYYMLSSVYYGIKGAGYYFAKDALLPYTAEAGISGAEYQLNSTIATIPWSMKGFIGVISDCFPLFGYYKTSYMIIFCLLGSIACGTMIFLPYSISESFTLAPGLLLFFIHLEGSATDLLAEGKYVSKMRANPHTKADVVTYVWFCQTIGQIVPSFTVGIIADVTLARYVYIIALPFLAQPLIFLFMGCMVDDKADTGKANRWDTSIWKPEWKVMTFALLFGTGVLVTVPLAVVGASALNKFLYSLIFSFIMCAGAFLVMKSTIARANMYIFLVRWLYVDIRGSLDYFYIGEPECVPNGPHFSLTFYRTYTSLAGVVCQFIGLYFFQVFVQNWNFRPAFWVTTVMRAGASLIDIVLVLRLNTAVGIPDWLLYLVGNAVIVETVYMMDFMPMNLLIAKLCPKDVESTMYAVLAGFMNFGSNLSSYTGLLLTTYFGLVTQLPSDGSPCNFDNLHYLVLIGHCLCPLLAIPFTFILIPNAYVTDDIFVIENSFKEASLKPRVQNQVVVVNDEYNKI